MKISFYDKDVSVKVSHLYTYGVGQPTDLSRRNNPNPASIDVDIGEIEAIIGGIVDPVEFKMFRLAAAGSKKNGQTYELKDLIERGNGSINNQGDGVLTQEQMEKIIYGTNLLEKEKLLGGTLYSQNKSRPYNADMAFILGSYTAKLSDKNRYYFKKGKLSHIEYATEVNFNDFDSNSSALLAKIVNPIIFSRIDPLKIGKSVKINTVGSVGLKQISVDKINRLIQQGSGDYSNKNRETSWVSLYRKWSYISGNVKTLPIVNFMPAPFLYGMDKKQIDFILKNLNQEIKNVRPNNKLDITKGFSPSTIANSDSFEASYKKRIALDKDQLNSETRPYARASSYIATDGFRVMNMNLAEKAIDTTTYRSPIGFSLDKSVEINRLIEGSFLAN